MALQSISLPLTISPQSLSLLSDSSSQKADKDRGGLSNQSLNSSRFRATITSEYYTSQKYALEFTSKDGDKVSFSYEALEYKKSEMEINAKGSSDDIKKLSDLVKDQLKNMSKEIVNSFLKDAGVNINENKDVKDTGSTSTVPEYWNADNTSQRIVDFAVSFFDAFKGKGEDFLNKIKSAIEDGFDQAKKAFGGAFPDAASKLVNDTHSLIIEKLNKWATDKNIPTDNQTTPVGVAS